MKILRDLEHWLPRFIKQSFWNGSRFPFHLQGISRLESYLWSFRDNCGYTRKRGIRLLAPNQLRVPLRGHAGPGGERLNRLCRVLNAEVP